MPEVEFLLILARENPPNPNVNSRIRSILRTMLGLPPVRLPRHTPWLLHCCVSPPQSEVICGKPQKVWVPRTPARSAGSCHFNILHIYSIKYIINFGASREICCYLFESRALNINLVTANPTIIKQIDSRLVWESVGKFRRKNGANQRDLIKKDLIEDPLNSREVSERYSSMYCSNLMECQWFNRKMELNWLFKPFCTSLELDDISMFQLENGNQSYSITGVPYINYY